MKMLLSLFVVAVASLLPNQIYTRNIETVDELTGLKSSSNCTLNNQTSLDLCRSFPGDLICSGAGECICGECVCKTYPENPSWKVYGQFCECSNFSCGRFNGENCGGPSRGTCDCGECHCKPEYHGDNCGNVNCTLGAKKCVKDGIVCSGNGKCDCDTCNCYMGFDGEFCDKCLPDEYCPLFQNETCGGESRGTCECGRCVCKQGYDGDHCGFKNCTLNAAKCTKNGVVCSGNGDCDCDSCVCNLNFYGDNCEKTMNGDKDPTSFGKKQVLANWNLVVLAYFSFSLFFSLLLS